MDKSVYLKRLEAELRKKYTGPQVKDILSDYEDFFASGAAEGKSEEELCAEFGSPEQAAGELKNESSAETPRRSLKSIFIFCGVLAVVFLAVFWAFHKVFFGSRMSLPNAAAFWLSLLFPLLLEGALALWLSQAVPSGNEMKWIPAVQIVLAVPVVAVIVWKIGYVSSLPLIFLDLKEKGVYVADVAGVLAVIVCLILLASIVLFMLYAAHGHERAHWFLFLDTTLMTLMLNFLSLLSLVNPATYDGAKGIAACFLWAVLPNLAAAGITWAVRKTVSVRRARAWTGR